MYNLNQLNTFVRVAELGSFNKVAEEDYLSPNTVMRQIISLEEELGGIKLFERNNKGSRLTEAGEALYNDAKTILADCEESKRRIMKMTEAFGNTIRLAVTYETEFDDLSTLWKKVHEKAPDIRLDVIPVIYDFKMNKSLWSAFKDHTDLLITYLSKHGDSEFKGQKYEGIGLRKAKLKCAMSSNHKLAGKKEIDFADLVGENVAILKHTWSNIHGAIISYIREKYPQINLDVLTYFSAEDYNDCANGSNIMLTFSDLTKAHPFITTVPVKESFEASLGLTYLAEPEPHVEKLVNLIKEIIENENEKK